MGQIMSFISQYDASRTEFREKFENVNNYLNTMHAPASLRKNVHNYFRFIWWRDQGMSDSTTLIEHLNDGMVSDIRFHLNGKILKSVNIFSGAPDGFIRDLCKRLLSQLYVPDEIIVKKGDPGKEMYLISTGAVAVEGDMGQRFAVLKSGQHFGEMALLFPMLRTATCRAIQYSDVFRLHYDDLHDILQEYPEVLESITKATLEKLETMQGINEETKEHIKRKSMNRRFSLNLGSNINMVGNNNNDSNSSITNNTNNNNQKDNNNNSLDDLLEIDSSIIDDIDEDYDIKTNERYGSSSSTLINRKNKKGRRVSVTAQNSGARLGTTGTILMRAFSDVSVNNDEEAEAFKEEYTRQKTWSLAKKWHNKSHHDMMEDDNEKHSDDHKKNKTKVKSISSPPSPVRLSSGLSTKTNHHRPARKKPVLFTGNDLLKQRRRLKKNGPIDLRDHLATLVDPDHVNYLVQNRNKEVKKDRSRELEMREQLKLAKQQRMKNLGVGVKR